VRDWADKHALEAFWRKLMLDIYFEFVRNQRDQRSWEEGMAVINTLGKLSTK
jgi:hypothetical protein